MVIGLRFDGFSHLFVPRQFGEVRRCCLALSLGGKCGMLYDCGEENQWVV